MHLHLIGRVTAEIDGQPVPLPPGRPSELLAWLAAHPGLHPRSRLAPIFWPDVPDATSRASLRTALWTLRKALGPAGDAVLTIDRSSVGLGGDALWVDLRELPEAAARDPAEALAAAVDAVLPGIEAEWADEVRQEHRRTVVELLVALEQQAEDDEDHQTALRAARRLSEIEPFSEERHRLLLRRLAAAGDHAAAIREHDTFRRLLWDELRVRPSGATAELVERLASSPDREPDAVALPSALRRAQRPVFVGRADECDELLAVWRDTLGSGGPNVLLLTGEAGIGKTSLAARFAAEVFGADASVLFGAAVEDALLPAEPFLEAIGEHHALGAEHLIDLVRQRIEERSSDRPLLLVLDDFQWADGASFALLRRLARSEAARHLAVLVLYRTGAATDPKLAALLADLARDGRLTRVDLGPLSLPATSELLAELDPGGDLSGRAERVHADTGGNPLYVHELGRHLLETPDGASVSERAGNRALGFSGPPKAAPERAAASAVPPSVRDLVVGRLHRLSACGAEAVAMAAVLGARAELAVVRHMTTGPDPLAGLEEGVAGGLVEEESAGVHVFRHAVVRDAVYESLSRTWRAELHRRAADAIRAVHGDGDGPHLCDIAQHRCAATPPDSARAAVADAERAGRWAIENHAYERAVVVLTKALRLADESSRSRVAVRRAVAYQRLTHAFIDPVSV